MSAEIEKRYPRGQVTELYGAKYRYVTAEMIELSDHGVLYKLPNEEETYFVPYHTIAQIKYEIVPEFKNKGDQNES